MADRHSDENEDAAVGQDQFDVFISYSRKDRDFASALERALESFRVPAERGSAARRVRVFRDEDDITGTDYNESIDRSLRASSKLVLVCSPAARGSPFVDDEVRRFVACRGPDAIIPVLVDGIPNNEAASPDDSDQAFPQALCEHVELPLAVEYRGFLTQRQRVDKKEWQTSWYTLLANICDVGRAEIEQRDRRRRTARRRRTWALTAPVLATLGLVGWIAISQARLRLTETATADSRARSTALASAATARLDSRPEEALVLAVAALRKAETFEAWEAVQASVQRAHLYAVLRGPEDDLTGVAFSPSGDRVVTTGEDRVARIWSTETGALLHELRGHTRYVRAAGFTPDGEWVVTAGDDETARVWSAESGEMLELWEGTERALFALAFTTRGTRPVTATWDEAVEAWSADVSRATPILEQLDRLDRTPTAVAFFPDAHRLGVGFADGTAGIWSTETGEALTVLNGHEQEINALAFSPDGTRIVSGSDDETARVWSADTGEELAVLRGHRDYVTAAVFSPDGQRIATASEDDTARLWNVTVRGPAIVFDSVSLERRPRGTAPWPEHDFAQLSPAGDRVLTVDLRGFDYQRIDLWSAPSGAHIRRLLQPHRALGAYFGPNGEHVAVIGDDIIWLYSAEAGEYVTELVQAPLVEAMRSRLMTEEDAEVPLTVGFGMEGEWQGRGLVIGRGFRPAWIDPPAAPAWASELPRWQDLLREYESQFDYRFWYELYLGQLQEGFEEFPSNLHVAPAGDRVAMIREDNVVQVFAPANAETLALLRGHEDRITDLRFSPDGSRLATTSRDGTARLWLDDGSEEWLLPHDSAVTWVEYGPEGDVVATASMDGGLRLWSTRSGRELERLGRDGVGVLRATFSPDGERILLIYRGWVGAQIWTASGDSLASLQDVRIVDGAMGLDVSFISPRRFIMGGQIWSAETGELLGTMGDFGTGELSATGDHFLMYGDGRPAALWPVSTDALLSTAEALMPVTFDEAAKRRIVDGH